MSSICNYLFRVFITNLRSIFHQRSPSSYYAQLETSHYQHGIPGIPSKVVLLMNSNNGALVYLIGTVHGSKKSVETVKEVIDYVRPDVVANYDVHFGFPGVVDHDSLNFEEIQLKVSLLQIFFVRTAMLSCARNVPWGSWIGQLYMLFRRSMRAAGGLCMKFVIFIQSCEERRFHAKGIFPGMECKVAIAESSRVGARCFYIDQDMDLTLQQLCKVSSFYWRWDAYRTRRAEEDDNSSVCITVIEGCHGHSE
ncbi:hypothetical protein MKW92_026296 [Papaver armeniacum]|nr:hypothetical protein MKW92_026296 [Papaver armeniacum]